MADVLQFPKAEEREKEYVLISEMNELADFMDDIHQKYARDLLTMVHSGIRILKKVPIDRYIDHIFTESTLRDDGLLETQEKSGYKMINEIILAADHIATEHEQQEDDYD